MLGGESHLNLKYFYYKIRVGPIGFCHWVRIVAATDRRALDLAEASVTEGVSVNDRELVGRRNRPFTIEEKFSLTAYEVGAGFNSDEEE